MEGVRGWHGRPGIVVEVNAADQLRLQAVAIDRNGAETRLADSYQDSLIRTCAPNFAVRWT